MPLPSEQQRKGLCELMHNAFVELRYLEGEQAHDLAYAFHNLPLEMYGWGQWSSEEFIGRLRCYQSKHHEHLGFNYVDAAQKLLNPAT
ncbi:hypothetical protein [Niveibacterium microcysteis]|uniref:Uncharacterized protein n=1 Tax=Niveibacterium microcysteis TaxID=2811415 RepID=A0ABX7M5F1_9RHOO|nr:hypothetical protein [Niveibacterium microcysteis]QSI76649.1 hypothetical protein JY500_19660 [Niveibacterium microcysteis]